MNFSEDMYLSCSLCPHNCKANRIGGRLGFCNTDSKYNIASICAHKGEEPVISGKNGICNVFFGHCNMQCLYCQNYQISDNKSVLISPFTEENAIDEICKLLDLGCSALGFVSPSHCIIQMADIIKKINDKGYKPIVVFNSNAYDTIDTLKLTEDLVDVYLPDFKYADDALAYKYSGVKNYSEIATKAIREMIRQKGGDLELNQEHLAIKGVIIRHLVLPHQIENSKKVLEMIAFNFGTDIHISLMSQYYPALQVKHLKELNCYVEIDAYKKVVDYLNDMGFENGWVQEIDSCHNYKPDFSQEQPFEKMI